MKKFMNDFSMPNIEKLEDKNDNNKYVSVSCGKGKKTIYYK